jgi:putative hydrolase
MLKIDLHTHTIASGHAFNTIYEMAKAASEKGVEILGITDHGPESSGSDGEVYFENLHRVPRELYGVKLLFGCESNIVDKEGNMGLYERTLQRLDFVSGFHIARSYAGSDDSKKGAILAAIKNPYVSVIVHPYYRPIEIDVEEMAQAACDNNKLVEISLTHFNKPDFLASERGEKLKRMIKIVKKNNFKILLGSDAHVVSELGIDDIFRKNMDRFGLTDSDIANNDSEYLRKFIKKI